MRPLEIRRLALPGDLAGAEFSALEIVGSERPFVLLHGLTGHRDDFRPVLPALAEGNAIHWLAPDIRGHGDFTKTGVEKTFCFQQLVDDLRCWTDALGIERFDLLGHSFGGMIALRFVLAHPERVASLVLMDTAPLSPDGYDRALFEKVGAIAQARGMSFLQERVEEAGRANATPSPSDLQTRKWADQYWPHHRLRLTAMDPVGYGALGIQMVEQEPVLSRLGEIACPTTVLVGDEDTEFLHGADLLEAGIPGVVRVTLPDAGHHPHMENQAAWLAAMREHVDRSGPR